MEKPVMMKLEVFDALKQIQKQNINSNLYDIAWKNEKAFRDLGLTLEDISDLMELKNSANFIPNGDFYQVFDQWREQYIYENRANPAIKLRGDNEREYLAAVRSCDYWMAQYEQKSKELAKKVSEAFDKLAQEQKVLEQEGVSSWKGARFQAAKAMEKIGAFLRRKNEPETLDLSKANKGEVKNDNGEKEVPKESVSPIVGQIAIPEPENMEDWKVMADNYKLWTLTDEQMLASDGVTVLHRIQANKDFNYVFGIDVLKGDLGGWIEGEKNLEGNSWVGDNAEVFGNAKVVDSAVMENAIVKDNARVINDSCVAGNARVTGGGVVDNSIITDDARINQSAMVTNSSVDGYSSLSGMANVKDCTCSVNTHIVNAQVRNMDMSGDIYIEDTEVGHGDSIAERGCVEYIRPALLTSELLKKLRASKQEGLREEVVCGSNGMELIADLNFVKGRQLTMELAVSNPMICRNGVDYDGQKVVNKLSELNYRIQDIAPECLAAMLNGKPQQLGPLTCVIQQEGEEFVLQNMTAQASMLKKHQSDVKLKNLFVFTGEEKIASNQVTVLHRIKANRDLSFIGVNDVPEGTIGGWIEKEDNLSGYSWVAGNAEVYGDAKVMNSVISGNSIVRDEAVVKESMVYGNSIVEDDAAVKESIVSGHARINGYAYLNNSVFAGYGAVQGRSRLENCFLRNNVNVVNSTLRYVCMEGDFLVDGHQLDCKTEGDLMKRYTYNPPPLISGDVLDKLRASPKEGLKCMTLVDANGRELIADLKLVEGKDMRLKLDIIRPIIWHNGANYSGQKMIDGLNKLHCDVTKMEPSQLSRMILGEPMRIRSVLYAVQQKGGEYALVDLRKRIGNIQIYPQKGGETAIRCTIDGVQQGARVLKEEDVLKLHDRTDQKGLAVNYFLDELRGSKEVVHAMRR